MLFRSSWCKDKDSIAAMTVGYFEKIYTTSSPSGIEEVTNVIPRRVTKEMNAELSRIFTGEEILKALHQMHPTKAPGPDGISASFYHKYWNIVGLNISNMVLNVLNSNLPLAEINKKTSPSSPRQTTPPK